MVAGYPSSHQPTRIREETLESGEPLQRKLISAFVIMNEVVLCEITLLPQ